MIKVGTRGSPLATRQADGATSNLVQPYELITIKSQGDIDQKTPINEMGGKHVFCSALEESLIKQEVDINLPTEIGSFKLKAYRQTTNEQIHLVIYK